MKGKETHSLLVPTQLGPLLGSPQLAFSACSVNSLFNPTRLLSH